MPQEIAATLSRSTLLLLIMLRVFIQEMQSASATQAPVMEAVRVPPSAWITSQSTVIWRSPSASRSTVARNERPIRRWISTVRPFCLPAEASRRGRCSVARGRLASSAAAPFLFARGGLAPGAPQRRPRQHAVFGRDPAPALALQPWRQPLFQGCRDKHMGIAEFDHAGTLGIFDDAALQDRKSV